MGERRNVALGGPRRSRDGRAGRRNWEALQEIIVKKKWIIALSFVAGILTCLFVPILILATGAVNMGADVNPGWIERTLAPPWVRDRSVAKRAPTEKNPQADDPSAIAAGLEHYRENCVMCHGAPGVAGAELSKGISPHAPELGKRGDDTPDGELFWVIKHGIRMTAMPAFGPTHTDKEIWDIVAFVRHLPNMSATEQNLLRAATDEEAHHHGGETNALPREVND